MITDQILKEIEHLNLLKHPYYQLWNMGKLDKEIIQDYANQYYSHVESFPRYISAIHSQCEDLEARQVLLENLIEEERGKENHPKLWRDFAFGLGSSAEKITNTTLYSETKHLVDQFFALCKSSYSAGLGALYAYESQSALVSENKIKGLKEFYGIEDEKTLKFFDVHKKTDIWHSDEVAELIAKLPEKEQAEAKNAAKKAAEALWGFLDGIISAHNLSSVKN